MEPMRLKDKAYWALKQSILNDEFLDNAILTERFLAEKLHMSRTPVRSAIEKLESEGYLHSTANRGITVDMLSLKQVIDFFDFRMAMEPYAVSKLAIQSISNEDTNWFLENLDQQQQCAKEHNTTLFTEYDSAFHRQLIRLYGNQEMIQTMEHLQNKLYRIALNVLKKDPDRIHRSIADHQNIWQAIQNKAPEQASKEMRQHLEYGKNILLR